MGILRDIARSLLLSALRKEMREVHRDLEEVAVVDAVAGVPGANEETKRRRMVISPLLLKIYLRSQGMPLHL